jgi:hypothetical protein
VDRLGGGDFVEIQPAVDAAADGDTILVRHDGSIARYGSVVVTGKGIVLVGEDVRPRAGSIEIRALPAGSTMVVANLELAGADQQPALRVDEALGFVLVEGCRIDAGFRAPACEIHDAADLVLTRSALVGAYGGGDIDGSPGLTARASSTVVYGCTIEGGSCNPAMWERAVDGGAGVVLDGGSFHAAGCELHGGTGQESYLEDEGGDGASGVVDSPLARARMILRSPAGRRPVAADRRARTPRRSPVRYARSRERVPRASRRRRGGSRAAPRA